ncbi:MAG: rhomboid family intramembrane serine protease [Corynebacteriales bacterium]|nr:rhomboid family intramembrane serine protease [Mycobacteriales bacterium]
MTSPAETPAESAPHCYRHPQRETWVTCTRCERPICPDCMNPASVGFQCPECVKEGNRGSRAARTVFGGQTTGDQGTVTKALIGVNVGVWLLSILVGLATGELRGQNLIEFITYGELTDFVRWGAAVPAELYTDGSQRGGIAGGEFWRLITAGFFHNGILHLALNMYGLWILGRVCEQFLGRWRFLLLYVLAGIGGATAEFLFRDAGTYAVGASGSIFGLMAALFFFHRALNLESRAVITLLVLNLGLGLFIPGISVIGHLGGLVVGGAVGACFAYAPRGESRTKMQLAGVAGVVLVLAGLIAVRISQYGLL